MASEDSRIGNHGHNSGESTVLISRFGYASAKLIHSVERNLYVVLGVIMSIAVISILNLLGILNYLYSENVDYAVDVILSIVLIIVVAPLVFLIVKSRKVLDNWNDMFERNTISTSMIMTMSNRSKEEALKALIYSVEEIGEPLQAYIDSKKSNLSEFLNVGMDTNIKFDVLVDTNCVLNDGSDVSNNLRKILGVYGAFVIKIVDGVIDKDSIESFADSLSKYSSLTNNVINLGVMIGEEITIDSREYASKVSHFRKKRIQNLLLLEKQSISPISE
jgi:hypothetical protein